MEPCRWWNSGLGFAFPRVRFKYWLADVTAHGALKVYDLRLGSWSELTPPATGFPFWSSDDKHVYWFTGIDQAVNRTEVRTRRTEAVVALKDFATVGTTMTPSDPHSFWMGLANDRPLVLRDAGTAEIYALALNW